MSTQPTTTDVAQRSQELHDFIASGRVLEAMHEFYDPDVRMQDDSEEPTLGFEANLAREKAWMENVQEWRSFELRSLAVRDNVSFAETAMEFVTKDGQAIRLEQVSRAVWRDGRIVDERFYRA